MLDLTYPSATFPPPPSMRMSVPRGWQPLPMPDAVMAAFDTSSPADFRVTILLVASRVVRSDADLAALAAAAHARTERQLAPTTEGSGRSVIANHDAILTVRTITTELADFLVFQTEALLVVPSASPDVRDLIQITGTCPATLAEHYGAIFRAAMQSLQLNV